MSKITSLAENCDLLMPQVQLRYNQCVYKNKMKNKKIPHCRNKSKIQPQKIVERGKIDTPNIQIHDRSLS